MTASIVSLCQDVTDYLNAAGSGTFSQTFTAVYEYSPQYTIPDAESLIVVVTDAGGQVDLNSRRQMQYTDSVRVVILWRVDSPSVTGIDDDMMKASLLLSEEIVEYLYCVKMGNYTPTTAAYRGDGAKSKQHYYPGLVDQGLVFGADITLEYQAQKDRR
jgi:GTPase SAR1 family protein